MLDLEVIGEGATSKVYRDGNKAVKLYTNKPLEEAENEVKRQMFACKSGLPVPKVYGIKQLDGDIAIEMELAGGEPLMNQGMSRDELHQALY